MNLSLIWHIAATVFVPDENGELTASTPPASLETLTELPPGDYGAALVKMLLTLIALAVLLFLSFWFLRRLIQQRMQKGVGTQSIQILEKRMISPKTMLYLIEVDNKKILLAESHLEVKRLESFTQVEEQEQPS